MRLRLGAPHRDRGRGVAHTGGGSARGARGSPSAVARGRARGVARAGGALTGPVSLSRCAVRESRQADFFFYVYAILSNNTGVGSISVRGPLAVPGGYLAP